MRTYMLTIGILFLGLYFWSKTDVLSGYSENQILGTPALQLAITGFCLSNNLEENKKNVSTPSGHDLHTNGDIDNQDYTKQSIYSILYSLYASNGEVVWGKRKYQFTFNTWGLGGDIPTAFPKSEPQRHGKAAYAHLIHFDKVKKYVKNNPKLKIIEIGCGTGAGAYLISNLLYQSTYTAIDMQKGAIDTCNRLHRHNRLKCLHTNGQKLPFGNNSTDIVIISETHIADIILDLEAQIIFQEIKRVLKPGGLFLWGNALPTTVWNQSFKYLPAIGLAKVEIKNVTQNAIDARIEDVPRVESYCNFTFDRFPILGIYPECKHTLDRLLKNFYRHPGTALFERMVTGYDSYMHTCWEKI